jgi:hypothetical protein
VIANAQSLGADIGGGVFYSLIVTIKTVILSTAKFMNRIYYVLRRDGVFSGWI